MSYRATVHKVMIASPSDVEEERKIVQETLWEWNTINAEDRGQVLIPVSWETHSAPSMEGRPQAVINRQVLSDCDLLIAVFWTRLGTPTEHAPSGTVEEIQRHRDARKPVMIYFSDQAIEPSKIDSTQYGELMKFRHECEKTGLIGTFKTSAEFRDMFPRQLSRTIVDEFGLAGSDPSDSDTAQSSTESNRSERQALDTPDSGIARLSSEAKRLLTEAAKDRNGNIMRYRTMGGLTIGTNRITLNEKGNPRSEAIWESAIEELVQLGLISEQGYKGQSFGVTAKGYEVADKLSDEP